MSENSSFTRIEKKGNNARVIASLIQKSFSGFPWHETLSIEECLNRILKDFQRDGFFGYLLLVENIPVAANWIDRLSINQVVEQRGENLENFVRSLDLNHIWWGRDLVVHPDQQMKGFGTQIREYLLRNLKHMHSGEFIFTRMRQDNIGSIKICEKLGYTKTGILVSSSQITGLFHEYYYLKL